MKEKFDKYVSNYDLSNPNIELKYNHSLRVMDLSEKYAQKLGFNEEEIWLASVIGLLHDLGRFEQLRVYHTYDDYHSIDHADYSVEQLFDKQLIRYFIPSTRKYDEIIKQAIQNHNKREISGVTDEMTMKFCYFIRDMDKLDIYYNMAILGGIKTETDNVPLSNKVLEAIRKRETVNTNDRKVKNDFVATILAFVFDIHYDILLLQVKQYIEIIYNKLENQSYFEEVKQIIQQYIEERMR